MFEAQDLIKKLINKEEPPAALKFVYAFNLLDKYPPVPLLKAFLARSKTAARLQRKEERKAARAEQRHGIKPDIGKRQSPDCNLRELAALRAVIRGVKEFNLEAEYPCWNLWKRIAKVEQLMANKKLKAGSASQLQQQSNIRRHPYSISQPAAAPLPPMAHSLTPVVHSQEQSVVGPYPSTASQQAVAHPPLPPAVHNQEQLGLTHQESQLQQQPNIRCYPYSISQPAAAAALPPMAHPLPPVVHSQQQSVVGSHPSTASQPAVAHPPLPPAAHNQEQLGLTHHDSHLGLAGSYGQAATSTGSLYDRVVPGVCLTAVAPGGNPTPASDLYSFESLLTSGLFGRPVRHGGL